MKKLVSSALALFICSTAHAGIIALNLVSPDSNAITAINANFNTIKNGFNGQTQGSATTGSSTNILAASIGYLDLGAEANPVTRDSELLGIGVDTFTAGTLVQTTFVTSGLLPVTSATLTSNVSAGVAFINGYRVSKVATAQTYAASMDTYLDISQTGVFTQSAVALGGTQPSVAANSARLAKVVTSGTAITSVTDLARRSLAGVSVPINYRQGMLVSRDSTSTIKVYPGTVEMNGSMVTKTTTTTLSLATAGDWAGGSSLRAVSTYGYVGEDTTGNIKLHTTAPAYINYALTVTDGKLRYASWSSTTYRILGWFYMNATSAGELNTYEVANIKEGDVANNASIQSTTQVSTTSASFVSDTQATQHFYSSGNPVNIFYSVGNAESSGSGINTISINTDGARNAVADRSLVLTATTTNLKFGIDSHFSQIFGQGTHTIQGVVSTDTATTYINARVMTTTEQ